MTNDRSTSLTVLATQGGQSVLASGWSVPLPLPFWLASKSKGKDNAKVRVNGLLDALYLDHNRLVLKVGEDDLIWVYLDKHTRYVAVTPEELKVGQHLQIDGLLQSDRLQASCLRLIHKIL